MDMKSGGTRSEYLIFSYITAGAQISFLNLNNLGESSLENDFFNVRFRIRLQLC